MNEHAALQDRLRQIARSLERIVALRAAFAPFAAATQARSDRLDEEEEWRQLFVLWRPCQAELDLLLDATAVRSVGTASLHILRQEMEDLLLDEIHHSATLVDLTDAFDQACEELLLRTVRELREAIDQLDGRTD